MKRRNVLGLITGTLSGSLLISSGAFNSARADREISVDVVTDERAYLALNALPTKSKDDKILGRSSNSGNRTKFRFPGMEEKTKELTRGDGLGTNSEYYFDELVEIRNQGTDPIVVYTDFSGQLEMIALYDSDDDNRSLLIDESTGIKLVPGDNFVAGVFIDSSGAESETTIKETISIVGKSIDSR